MTQSLMSATLIYDGKNPPIIPAQLLPSDPGSIEKAGQNQGTNLERLCEIAGRSCYDSFGRGRASKEFHEHILQVGHLSVIEHAVFTVEMTGDNKFIDGVLLNFFNKASLWVNRETSIVKPRITLNLRHVLEWMKATSKSPAVITDMYLDRILRSLACSLAPQIISAPNNFIDRVEDPPVPGDREWVKFRVVPPETAEEHWLSFFLTGSRGFSHELVRHGDWTAISQRSTRYVDESESSWVMHPLMTTWEEYTVSEEYPPSKEYIGKMAPDWIAQEKAVETIALAKKAYGDLVPQLQKWLEARGVDKTTARKQARGAARGYLGNALYTEVVFSASASQWRHMIRMRANPAADAEIREVFVQVVEELQRADRKDESWAKFFADITLAPSPDGIGRIAIVP